VWHELSSNAAKYGALANDAGRIEIMWRDNELFVMSWTEHGAERISLLKERRFGTTVVKTMAELSLGETQRWTLDLADLPGPQDTERPPGGPRRIRFGRRLPVVGRVLIVEDEALIALDIA
jgi:hypothetical protein